LRRPPKASLQWARSLNVEDIGCVLLLDIVELAAEQLDGGPNLQFRI
jgi:hypothetical protein